MLEQIHRASPSPTVEGMAGEEVALAEGRRALLHAAPAEDGATALTLIMALPAGRWLSLRASGMDRDTVLDIARHCAPHTA
ncbi:hypothetical protein [Ancylobacter vacuolatus]|uniref:Uncharacterized protein n=1 Tax=Ancylobacter vacuolatus TaxID=223389 RepID=A0ABU0DI01_9HYPH|nr:hypothetical protein [Ancylobacter vacuolatus]MDQ0348062.1 hypothetical protein [Ancylobacter vacuolatus]